MSKTLGITPLINEKHMIYLNLRMFMSLTFRRALTSLKSKRPLKPNLKLKLNRSTWQVLKVRLKGPYL